MCRASRSIADFAGADQNATAHIAKALQYWPRTAEGVGPLRPASLQRVAWQGQPTPAHSNDLSLR